MHAEAPTCVRHRFDYWGPIREGLSYEHRAPDDLVRIQRDDRPTSHRLGSINRISGGLALPILFLKAAQFGLRGCQGKVCVSKPLSQSSDVR